jgi:hypothetical protein
MMIGGVLFACMAFAPLPAAEAETLAGAKVSLPQVFGSRPAILIWSFSREGGAKVKDWFAALDREAPGEVYSVAMLEAAPRLIRGLIRSGMRGGTPAHAHSRTLLLYKGGKEWRSRLGLKDAALPLIVVLDSAGEIVWSRGAAYSSSLAVEAITALRRK